MTTDIKRDEGRIQSLERGFMVMEEVARNRDGATLSELSRILGLHTSTLYHLTRTLVALGYLRTGPDDKRYRVGRGIYQLASACLDEAELCATVEPFLDRLAAATGEATHFAIWERRKALILTRREGPNPLQITERPGTLRPVHCTAIGKVLLSGLTDQDYDDHVAEMEFTPITPNTLRDAQTLRLHIDRARREGIAYDDCEFNPEVRCMAAPVRDFRGKLIGAIGFSGPVWRMSLTGMSDYISVTRSIAAEISDQMGFRPSEVVTKKDAKKRHGKG
ncbi:MAG: IclR family transcriptional regulator [Pseudaminobacter sp.]|nr:IclR family transcriptional regulator [Pseudaminobacter sp.]